jgi:ribosomal protein S18 acetylase RimI-like enzyme
MPSILDSCTLRPERAEDGAFLREVYDASRKEELDAAGVPMEMRKAFLDMQFKAQRIGYQSEFPHANFDIILVGAKKAGRIVVNRSSTETTLVDIALLPEHRNHGIGTALIRKLSVEAAAAGLPLRLSVVKGQRAARLYLRLGFVKTSESGWHDMMELPVSHATKP